MNRYKMEEINLTKSRIKEKTDSAEIRRASSAGIETLILSKYRKRALPDAGSGFGAANGDTAKSRLLQPVFEGPESGSGEGRGRYYVSFRGEDPSARTFVDILVSGAPPLPWAG